MKKEYKEFLYTYRDKDKDEWTVGLTTITLEEILKVKEFDEKKLGKEVKIYEFDRQTGQIKRLYERK
uniref:Uncharacterized protein n=1 Tax=Caldisericum exile TaxID=693075 RepID=A0A7C4U4B7_9BACT